MSVRIALIILAFQVFCSGSSLAQKTTVINHYPKDTTGLGEGGIIPSKTAEHRIIINYYEPADAAHLDQFQALVSSYINLYVERCAIIEEDDVKLKKSKKETLRDLDNIVKGALEFYDYQNLKGFKGFSVMVSNKLASIDELNFSKTDFAAGAADDESKQRMQKFYLEKELSDLKLLANMEVGIYGDDNLMVISSSDETLIDDEAKKKLMKEYTSFDPKEPLRPIRVQLSDESLALINFQDTSTLPLDDSGENGVTADASDFAAEVLKLLEVNNQKLDGMQQQIDDLRTEQIAMWEKQQEDRNLTMQRQIDDLREMVFALVQMNTGDAIADAGNATVKPTKLEGTVSNLPGSMNVFFPTGSSRLDAGSKMSLNEIVDILARSPSLKLIVTGYADRTGDAAKNLLLSQQRANEVKRFLASSGLSPDRFITKYFGDRDSRDESSSDRKVMIEFVR